MAVTNSADLANKMLRFRSHGITSEPEEMFSRPNNEIWNYQQIRLGFNYRMTDIHAALGISQFSHLDEFTKTRRHIANRYNNELASLPFNLPEQHKDNFIKPSSFTLFELKKQNVVKNQDKFMKSVLKKKFG